MMYYCQQVMMCSYKSMNKEITQADSYIDEDGVRWEKIKPTFFDKIFSYFGLQDSDRGYVAYFSEGKRWLCGTTLYGDLPVSKGSNPKTQ